MAGRHVEQVAAIHEPQHSRRRWPPLMGGLSGWLVLATVLCAVLVILIVAPLGWLVYTSLKVPGQGLGLANYIEIITNPMYLTPILNSFRLGLMTVGFSVLFGVPVAWLCTRTDMPLRRFVRVCAYGAFITPSIVGGTAWILLGGPRAGLLNKVYMALLGTEKGFVNIFSLAGLAFVIALYTYPYVYLFTANALASVSSDMEDASYILGGGPVRTSLYVTLPLALPAILGACILVFLETIALFGAPALLSIPARMHVMTTQTYLFFAYPRRVELAAAYGIPLLIVTLGMFILRRWILGRRGFTTVGSKPGQKRLLRLGWWKIPTATFSLLVSTLSLLLPVGVLLYASFIPMWPPTGGEFTFSHYVRVLTRFTGGLWNTLWFSAVAASAAMVIGFVVAYINRRQLFRGAGTLAFIATAPQVIPGMVLAIGIFAAYSRPPLFLYGTAAIIIIAYTTRFLPIAYSSLDASLHSLHHELEEAAMVLGASRLRTITSITLPLMKGGLLSGWFLTFIPALRELSTVILLFGPHTKVASVILYELYEEANIEAMAALGMILMAATLVSVGLAYLLAGKDVMLIKE